MTLPLKLSKKKHTFKEFLETLAAKYNINYIYASFSGGGDSGEIEEVIGKLTKESDILVEFDSTESETLTNFIDRYLESTGYDWYNNDGGSGDIWVEISTGKIECEMSINYMTSDEYSLEDEGDYVNDFEI